MDRLTKLCDFIDGFLVDRNVISTADVRQTRKIKPSRRVQALLGFLDDATVTNALLKELSSTPSFSWFADQLRGITTAEACEEAPLADTVTVAVDDAERKKKSRFREQHFEGKHCENDDDDVASIEADLRRLSVKFMEAAYSPIHPTTPARAMTTARRPADDAYVPKLRTSIETNDSNDVLRLKFQKLHAELVRADLSPVKSDLFTAFVLSSADMQRLLTTVDVPARTEQLLAAVHVSTHPNSFVCLRLAMLKHPQFFALVEAIDGLSVPTQPHEMHRQRGCAQDERGRDSIADDHELRRHRLDVLMTQLTRVNPAPGGGGTRQDVDLRRTSCPPQSRQPSVPLRLTKDTGLPETRQPTRSASSSVLYGRMQQVENLSAYDWFAGKASRDECVKMLASSARDGSFFVRDSPSGGSECPFALTVFNNGSIAHLRISQRPPPDSKYSLLIEERSGTARPEFNTLANLIAHYQQHPITVALAENGRKSATFFLSTAAVKISGI